MKHGMKRKGFTLVELLIVIVVIGILSAMMMMSSTEATTSAKVSNIVSNLRNLKTAALAFYADSMDTFVSNPEYSIKDKQDLIWGYLGTGNNAPDKADYKVTIAESGGDGAWWAMYNITGSAAEQASIKKKLAGRAKSLGLKGVAKFTEAIGKVENTVEFNATHGAVMLQVR